MESKPEGPKDHSGFTDKVSFRMGKVLQDRHPMRGRVEWVLRGPDGEIKEQRTCKLGNVLCEAWDEMVASQLKDTPTTAKPSHMGVGTSTGGKNTSSSSLEALIAGSRTALDSTTQGTGDADNDIIYVCTLGAGVGTGAIREIGLYNADNDSAMLAYKDGGDVGTITKGADDSLQITWTVTNGAS